MYWFLWLHFISMRNLYNLQIYMESSKECLLRLICTKQNLIVAILSRLPTIFETLKICASLQAFKLSYRFAFMSKVKQSLYASKFIYWLQLFKVKIKIYPALITLTLKFFTMKHCMLPLCLVSVVLWMLNCLHLFGQKLRTQDLFLYMVL